MHLENLDRKYLTILVASSIELIKIIVLGILKMALALSITNARFLNPVFLIGATIYVRFGPSKSYLYMRVGNNSFNNICIYLNTFKVIVTESISIGITEKTFLR